MRRVLSRLVVPVVLLGLLAGCASHDRGYRHEPIYRPVHGTAYGPVYGPVYSPVYGPVHGHAHGRGYGPVYGPGVDHYRSGHHSGYRIEQREIRVPVQRQYQPRHGQSYRPPMPHGHGVNPPVRRPERPAFAPGYRSDERHQRPRDNQRPHQQRGDRDRDRDRDRYESRGGHWQGSPRPSHDGPGRSGRGEHRGHR